MKENIMKQQVLVGLTGASRCGVGQEMEHFLSIYMDK
jgi:hypothetical protein